MIPASALIDQPAVQCPGCGQPLNVSHDWGSKLRITRRKMLCCTRQLTVGEANVLLSKIKGARD